MIEDSAFLFSNPFARLGSFIEEFVYSQDFSATVKDSKTGKYIIGNNAITVRDGISCEEYEYTK